MVEVVKNMDKRGIASTGIAVIVVIVAIAAVGVGYFVTRGAAPGAAPSDIEAATSLSFKVDTPLGGVETFRVKNIGSPNIKFRRDGTILGEEYIEILDVGEEKVWMWTSTGGWTDMSAIVQTAILLYRQLLEEYKTELSEWTGGDHTYTDPMTDGTVRIYDIEVNPTLPDTLFQHG